MKDRKQNNKKSSRNLRKNPSWLQGSAANKDFTPGYKSGQIKRIVVVGILIVSAAVAIVMAQAEPDDVGSDKVLLEQKPSGLVSQTDVEVVEEHDSVGEQVMSINFRTDMSIRDALRFLAAKYQKNIVPSSKVNGKLNITSLYEVNFEEALSAILGNSFKYDVEGNFIRIYAADEYAKMKEEKSRLTSKVFTLYYVNAAEVKALVEPILSDEGEISTTTAAAVDTEAGEGGDTLSMRDMISVYDFPERIAQIGEMIEQIDVRPPQILVEVTIFKAKLDETTEFGIQWDNVLGATVTQSTAGFSVGLAASGISSGSGLAVGIQHEKIQALVTALEGVTDTTVLANPKIMALNKQAGHVLLGDEKGYLTTTTVSDGGTSTQEVDFLEVGTSLRFRPFICKDGYIRMEIFPEESTGTVTEIADSVIPTKSTTQIKTNIMVQDGRTIVIGGLFKEDLTNTNSQVPLVGDIPVIGSLFKSTKDVNIRTELVILLTPHIINDSADTWPDERITEIDRLQHGSRKRISSVSRPRIYEDKYAAAVDLYSQGRYDEALDELDGIIAFRPNALEAIELKEKILAETDSQAYQKLERKQLDEMSKKLDQGWIRR